MTFLVSAGIDTRALTKILREKGTMNGMITTDENYDLDDYHSETESIYYRKSSGEGYLPRKDTC